MIIFYIYLIEMENSFVKYADVDRSRHPKQKEAIIKM